MADNQGKNLNELFSALPENVKKWLSSEELVFIITEIENKLGLDDEKALVIPELVLRLIVQDIEPQDFIGELSSGLGVDFNVAKTVTEDIEKNILRPIAAELRDKLGLEVKLVYYGKIAEGKPKNPATAPTARITPPPAPVSTPAAIPPAAKIAPAAPSAAAPADLSKMTPPPKPATPSAPAVAKAPIPQPIRKEETVSEPAVPFILHQENSPTAAPSINLNPKPQAAAAPKTSLTMKVQNYFQSASAPERAEVKPISIKVEAPAAQQTATRTEQPIPVMKQPAAPALKPQIPSVPVPPPAPGEQARVVHYSNLRTPLDNLGLPKKEVSKDNVVDLRKFL